MDTLGTYFTWMIGGTDEKKPTYNSFLSLLSTVPRYNNNPLPLKKSSLNTLRYQPIHSSLPPYHLHHLILNPHL